MRFEAYVDAGFVRAAGASCETARTGERVRPGQVRINAPGMARAIRGLAKTIPELDGMTPRMTRLYDAVVDPGHPGFDAGQRYRRGLEEAGLRPCMGALRGSPLVLEDNLGSVLRTAAASIGADPEALVAAVNETLERNPIAVMRQKGVDTKLATHLVRRAAEDQFATAVLMSGDSDFAPVVELLTQQYGKRVVLLVPPGTTGATPGGTRVGRDLLNKASDAFELSPELFQRMYRRR